MTIAQQLNVKEFPFIIKDKNGNEIYYENSDRYWYKKEYDANGNQTQLLKSDGYWSRRKYDAQGNEIHFVNSIGTIRDNRPKVQSTMNEIATN